MTIQRLCLQILPTDRKDKMPDFSRLCQTCTTFTFAIILSGCNTTTDTSYEPETQVSDRKVGEITQVKKPNSLSPRLETKLAKRGTINPFRAWHLNDGTSGYGLYWSGNVAPSQQAIVLNEVYWNYTYTSRPVPGIDPYVTKRNWDHDTEYGKTFANKIIDTDFQNFIVEVVLAKLKLTKSDGVMLDWWHDYHESSSGYSKSQVRTSRRLIAQKLRNRLGPNKIILTNPNWQKDKSTVKYINGVFLELFKSSTNRVYNSRELVEIEKILEFYESNLAAPKLIALNGWRKTAKSFKEVGYNYRDDRNSPQNRKMAKLLAAMSVVVPTNGYILYGDNNPDTPNGDHGHNYYDFYSFDIGKPTRPRLKVSNGVSYKQHQKGFVAYNITSRTKKFELKDSGRTVSVEPKSGLFCKESGDDFDCLTVD